MQFCDKYGISHVENAILGYLIDIFDLSHPCYVYFIPIFLAIKISSAKKVKPGISQDKEDIFCNLKKTKVFHGISYILSLGPIRACWALAAGAFGTLWLLLTRVARPLLAPSCITVIRRALVSSTDRPPDEHCPAQTPTDIGRCSPSCQTRWKRLHSRVGISCPLGYGACVGWSV